MCVFAFVYSFEYYICEMSASDVENVLQNVVVLLGVSAVHLIHMHLFRCVEHTMQAYSCIRTV